MSKEEEKTPLRSPYELGYANGYGDGFSAGLEAGKKIAPSNPYSPPNFWPDANQKPKCNVCGMVFEGVMGYVCPHSKCPSKITCGRLT